MAKLETPADIVAAAARLKFRLEEVDAVVARMGMTTEWAKAAAEISTGQYDHARQLLSDLLSEAPEDLRRALLDDPDRFAIGACYLPSMNASSFVAPNGGSVVLIDPRLIAFYYKLARVLTTRMRFADADLKEFPLAESAELAREILEALIATGDPVGRDYFVEPSRIAFASRLATCAERFIVGHELSHHLLGHSADPGSVAAVPQLDLAAIEWNWDQEYAADRFALVVLLTAGRPPTGPLDGHEVSWGLAGVNLAMSAIALLEDYREKVTRIPQTAISHPPTQGRIDRLRVHLEEMLSQEDVPAVMDLADHVGRIVDWVRVEVGLLPATWDSMGPQS
jgi:hypothetical protein